jgi:hypothetical protein
MSQDRAAYFRQPINVTNELEPWPISPFTSVTKIEFYPWPFVQSRAKPSPVAISGLQRDGQHTKPSTSESFGSVVSCLDLVRTPRGTESSIDVRENMLTVF